MWPAGPPRRALALLALDAAFSLVARASGAGWVVVLLCGVAAVLVLAIVWPVVTLIRAKVELLESPRDATAGSLATFAVSVRRAGSGVRLRLIVANQRGPWVAAFGRGQGPVSATPPRRGVVTEMTAEVEAAGPVGLVPWRRRIDLNLAAPLEVGPTPEVVTLDELAELGSASADAPAGAAFGHDTVRGVRAYATGDPLRIIHWPATARWGELMVKEMDVPTAPALTIVVDLRGEADRSEAAASLAAGLAGAGVRAGLAVCLLTAEGDGPRSDPVTSTLLVGRRLARAVTNAPPPEPPPDAPAVVRVTADAVGRPRRG